MGDQAIIDCKCKLCCQGDLPGIESHLFSEFLIKETINRAGKTSGKNSKGQEFLFTLSPVKGAELFFKGDSTEHALEFLQKSEFTEEEIELLNEMANPLTDRNLVCYKCEKLFQPIEDQFKIIYDKIISNSTPEGNSGIIELSENDKLIVELFLILNIWRTSMSEKTNWKLDDTTNQCLTQLLYLTLINNSDDKDYLSKYKSSRNKFKCFELILFISNENPVDPSNPNENFVYSFDSTDPFLVVINRLVIFISTNNFDTVGTPDICQGVIDNLAQYAVNGSNVINIISKEKLQQMNHNLAILLQSEFMEHLLFVYREAYKHFFRCLPEEQVLQEIYAIGLQYLGYHYKYGASESGLLEAIAQHLYKEYLRLSN